MKKRVFLFPTAVFLGTACLLSGCGKKSATDNAGEVYVYNWGTVGILYNTSMVAPEDVPTKWADLWDEKFKGEILKKEPTYGSIPGSFRKMQRIKKMLKNGLISCAVRILPR